GDARPLYTMGAMPTHRLLPTVAALLAGLAPIAAHAEPRPLTLDEALRSARDHNRDLKAAREHLKQAAVDIDRARALLLPVLNLQGKYTINYPEVTVDFSGLTAPFTVFGNALQDLYMQTGKVPNQQVLQGLLALQNAPASQPATITPTNQLDLNISAQVPIVVPYAWAQLRSAKTQLEAQEKTTDAQEALIL